MGYKVLDLGIINFHKAYLAQREVLQLVRSGACIGAVILSEHLPVFTMGRLASPDNFILDREYIRSRGIDIVHTDRGGDITFHGPGQIVAYPIFNLNIHGKDMHRFLRSIEEVIISLLARYGIASFRIAGRTGCWTREGKIASIGISASNWVTYHGLALNANTDLKYFDMINPCGYKHIKTTSIRDITRRHVDMETLKHRLLECFEGVFGIQLSKASLPLKPLQVP
jgi:lipoyl(octanoyl) transferase